MDLLIQSNKSIHPHGSLHDPHHNTTDCMKKKSPFFFNSYFQPLGIKTGQFSGFVLSKRSFLSRDPSPSSWNICLSSQNRSQIEGGIKGSIALTVHHTGTVVCCMTNVKTNIQKKRATSVHTQSLKVFGQCPQLLSPLNIVGWYLDNGGHCVVVASFDLTFGCRWSFVSRQLSLCPTSYNMYSQLRCDTDQRAILKQEGTIFSQFENFIKQNISISVILLGQQSFVLF